MMRKLDLESTGKRLLALQSQNISIVEVGAHAQVFKEFIKFVGLKSLVITDIDSIGDNSDESESEKPKACRVKDGTKTSNSALKSFFPKHGDTLDYFKNLTDDEKCIGGMLRFAYQTEEEGYHARSFEDAFFHINKDFIKDKSHSKEGEFNKDAFPNVTQTTLKKFCSEQPCDAYDVAKAVDSKPSFAMEILLNSDENFSNWHIPAYIKEGLTWLQADKL
jgi:putative ATP-dependent endonuclease of OLD family